MKYYALFIAPIDQPGGAERVMAIAARELSKQSEWDVEIAILAKKTPSFLALNSGNSKISYGHGRGKFGSECILIPRLMKRKYDLVYSSHMRINAFLSFMRKIGILKCQRLVTRESSVVVDRSQGIRKILYKILYKFYGNQDLIIAQTDYMRERIKKIIPKYQNDKIKVIKNPIDTKTIKQLSKEKIEKKLLEKISERKKIVWCGRLIDIKQPLLAIDVLSLLVNKENINIGLVMIGDGPKYENVHSYAKEKNLTAC